MSVDVLAFITECQSESQLHNNPGVDSVTMTIMNYDNVFNFDDSGSFFCGPATTGPFTLTISYSSLVLLRQIDIHGHDRTFPIPNQFVTSFSLSFSEDYDNFTEYTRDTGSTVCYSNNTHVTTH